MRHPDLVCRLRHIVEHYNDIGIGWWENKGLALNAEPDWPGDSIMVVAWPKYVIYLRFNRDCAITGPYDSLTEALACASHDARVMPDVA